MPQNCMVFLVKFAKYKENHTYSRHIIVDHIIPLLKHFSIHNAFYNEHAFEKSYP